MIKYISIENKKVIVNDEVFDYTDKIKIMCDDSDVCILQKSDSKIIEINALKGQVIKLYIYINEDWLYFDKTIYNYKTIKISNDLTIKFLTERDNLIKEIISYGTKI